MGRLRTLLVAVLPSFLLGAGVRGAIQQTPATTRREPQFENEQLKVWKSIILPNQPLNVHRHDHGRALIALVGGKLDVVDEKGNHVTTYDWQSGRAYWLPADPPGKTHGDVNHGPDPIEVIVVELKNDQ